MSRVWCGAERLAHPVDGSRNVFDQQDAPAEPVERRRVHRLLEADAGGRRRPHEQFVGQHLQPDEALHPGDQRNVVDRLGEEVVGAGFEPGHPVRRLVEGGDDDDRDMGGARIGLQAPAGLEAVHARHHDVEKDDVALAAGADLDRLRPVHCGDHLEVLGRQARLEELYIGDVVVDDENSRGHLAEAPRVSRRRDRL